MMSKKAFATLGLMAGLASGKLYADFITGNAAVQLPEQYVNALHLVYETGLGIIGTVGGYGTGSIKDAFGNLKNKSLGY